MPELTIRGLDDNYLRKLQERAATNGRSLETEACTIVMETLQRADADAPERDEPSFLQHWLELAAEIRREGGVELPIPPRSHAVRSLEREQRLELIHHLLESIDTNLADQDKVKFGQLAESLYDENGLPA